MMFAAPQLVHLQSCHTSRLKETHLSFVVAAANLRANVFHLKGSKPPFALEFRPATILSGESSTAVIKAVLAKVHVPPFVPQSGIKIETDEKKAAEARAAPISDEAALQKLIAELPVRLPGFQVQPQEFEKVQQQRHISFYVMFQSG